MRRQVAGVMLLAGAMAACGVAAGDKKYVPNELQATKLKYLRSEAVLAKVGLEQAQQNFQSKLNALSDEAKKIKGENKWGDEVQFNPDTLDFALAKPADATKPPEVKKP